MDFAGVAVNAWAISALRDERLAPMVLAVDGDRGCFTRRRWMARVAGCGIA